MGGSLRIVVITVCVLAPKDSDLAEEYAMTMNHMILEEVENQLVNG